jgi:hypothetical protein
MVQPQFCDHTIVSKNPDDYVEVQTSPASILKVWKLSFFAHELLNKDGSVKTESELSGDTLQKFIAASEAIKRGEELQKPILGIGIYDGIEIGIGREIIAAAYHLGLSTIPASIRKGQADEIQSFLN